MQLVNVMSIYNEIKIIKKYIRSLDLLFERESIWRSIKSKMKALIKISKVIRKILVMVIAVVIVILIVFVKVIVVKIVIVMVMTIVIVIVVYGNGNGNNIKSW